MKITIVLLPACALLVLLAVCTEPAAGDDAPHALQKRADRAGSPPKSPPKQSPPKSPPKAPNSVTPWFLRPQGPMPKPVPGKVYRWRQVPNKFSTPNSGGAGPSGKKSPPKGKGK